MDTANNTWPEIEKTPGVVGGAARIERSRIPVWLLEGYRRLGWDEGENPQKLSHDTDMGLTKCVGLC